MCSTYGDTMTYYGRLLLNNNLNDEESQITRSVVGTTSFSTTRKLGSHSLYINGGWLYHSAGGFTTSDFQSTDIMTVDFWMMIPSGGIAMMAGFETYYSYQAGYGYWNCYHYNNNNGVLCYFYDGDGVTFHVLHFSSTNNHDNTWHHYVMVKDGVNVEIYFDGSSADTVELSVGKIYAQGSHPPQYGSHARQELFLSGYLDNLIYYKGEAKDATYVTTSWNNGDGTEDPENPPGWSHKIYGIANDDIAKIIGIDITDISTVNKV